MEWVGVRYKGCKCLRLQKSKKSCEGLILRTQRDKEGGKKNSWGFALDGKLMRGVVVAERFLREREEDEVEQI